MKKGDWVNTPRFCKVKIEKVFSCYRTAAKQGFTVSAYFSNCEYDVRGKIVGDNRMTFAAIKKGVDEL